MKEQDFFVSVVIPNYCHANFLDQRIQSVLNQTYQNFELIILDDKSPDDGASRTVIEKYRENPHVSHIVYNEENSGSTFKQWNKGFSLARGSLIWIAESDDYCENTLLEKLVEEFKKDDKLTLAFCRSQKVDSVGKPIVVKSLDFFKKQHLSGKDFINRFMVLGNFCNNASACLFKKEIALRIDSVYTSFRAAGDAMFWIEIAEQGNVAVIKEKLNYFRQHHNKVTPQKTLQGVNSKEFKKIFDYLVSRKVLRAKKQRLMFDYHHKMISERNLASEGVRQDLFVLWNFTGAVGFWGRIKLKLLLLLRHRLNLYI